MREFTKEAIEQLESNAVYYSSFGANQWQEIIKRLLKDWKEMYSTINETVVKELAKKLMIYLENREAIDNERNLMIARIRELEKISENAMQMIDNMDNPLSSNRSDLYHTLYNENYRKLFKIIKVEEKIE